MKLGFGGLREGEAHRDGGWNERPNKPVRVTVVTRGLKLGLLTTALAAAVALDRWGEPQPDGIAASETLTKEGGVVKTLALSPDGRSLAVARSGDQVAIWDVASHRRRRILPTMSLDRGLAFSPDGKVLAVADEGPAIRLWDAHTGDMLGTLEHPGRKFLWLAYSPDSRTLAASCHDNTVMIWDVPTARVQDTHRGHCSAATAIAFSPDGRTLAFTERGGSILAWDVERGRVRAEMPGHVPLVQMHTGKNVSIVFAPGSKVFASQGAFDPLVKLWDLDDGRLLGTIEVEPSLGQVVSFSSDGGSLILASHGALREWNFAKRRSEILVDGLSPNEPRFAVTPDGARTLAIAEGGLLTLRQRATRPGTGGASLAFQAHSADREGEMEP